LAYNFAGVRSTKYGFLEFAFGFGDGNLRLAPPCFELPNGGTSSLEFLFRRCISELLCTRQVGSGLIKACVHSLQCGAGLFKRVSVRAAIELSEWLVGLH
jgi:hypothetical protein